MLPEDQPKFWSCVSLAGPDASGCWLWTGEKLGRYGMFSHGGKSRVAHRVAYEDIVGPIPPGLVLDHLCRNPSCVNPFHLEPVTRQVNALRGLGPRLASERLKARHRARTHCKRGHPWIPENMYMYRGRRGRRCRLCAVRWLREWRKRKKSAK